MLRWLLLSSYLSSYLISDTLLRKVLNLLQGKRGHIGLLPQLIKTMLLLLPYHLVKLQQQGTNLYVVIWILLSHNFLKVSDKEQGSVRDHFQFKCCLQNVAHMQVYQLSTNFHAILKLKNLLSLIPDVSSLSQLQNLSCITPPNFPRFVHFSCERYFFSGAIIRENETAVNEAKSVFWNGLLNTNTDNVQ